MLHTIHEGDDYRIPYPIAGFSTQASTIGAGGGMGYLAINWPDLCRRRIVYLLFFRSFQTWHERVILFIVVLLLAGILVLAGNVVLAGILVLVGYPDLVGILVLAVAIS
jgi:hypothetical protein